MFNPSRQEVREFFCGIWSKHQNTLPLTPLEAMALPWLQQHPEYHALLDNKEKALTQDFDGSDGRTNPFLHLSLHLSIAEQISIDQPPGIRRAYLALAQKLDSEHEAHHRIMIGLSQVLWDAQQTRSTPDSAAYLAYIEQQLNV